MIADPDIDDQGWFDLDRFLEMHDGMVGESGQPTTGEFTADEIPYRPRIDVEETWLVTCELVEQFTVESHIEDMEIKESDTTEDHDLDVSDLHRKIAESGLLDVDRPPNEVMTEFDIESEIDKDDRISTHFERERVIQNKVVDRKRLYIDVTDNDLVEMETLRSKDTETERVGNKEFVGERDETTTPVSLTDNEIGKTVVNASKELSDRLLR